MGVTQLKHFHDLKVLNLNLTARFSWKKEIEVTVAAQANHKLIAEFLQKIGFGFVQNVTNILHQCMLKFNALLIPIKTVFVNSIQNT